MNNPLHSPLMRLFDRLSFLNGLLTHLENQSVNYLPLLKKAFEEQNLDPSIMRAGVALTIRDLTQPVNSFRAYHPVGSSVSHNLNEYQHMLEIVLYRNCGWAVAQGYEAFETYLKDITAIYIQRNVAAIDPAILKKLTPGTKKLLELSNLGFSQTDFEYWKSCIAYTRWNNKDIVSQIRDEFSKILRNVEQDNQHSIDFVEWFDIVSEVRHAVTHSNGIIKPDKQKPTWTQQTLNLYFPGNVTSDGYELQLTVENAERNLQLFAEYGYVIFKCLSDEQNYTVNVLTT